jgi:hypothetical protein
MLKLRLSPILLGSRLTLGPAPWFCFDGNVVRQGPGRKPVAELRNHHWNAGGRHFIQLQADGETRVRFAAPDRRGSCTGPYTQLHWSDGAMYAGERLIARFDEQQGAWICVESGESWPMLELLDAETAGNSEPN